MGRVMIAYVTQRQIVDSYGEAADKSLHNMIDYVVNSGFTVVPVPNSVRATWLLVGTLRPDLVVLTGGGFVPSEYYDEPCEGAGSQPRRDAVERFLVKYAVDHDVPVVGVCRGMHWLNGYFGGTIRRHASAFAPREDHEVALSDGSRIIVNSFHEDAVPISQVSPKAEVLAVEESAQTVEAFRITGARVLGLQWHPERPLGEKARQVTEAYLKDLFA